MSDRLSRSNSQSNLPNYGQGEHEDKNTDVANNKNGNPAQSDKNTGRGYSERQESAPQMKSREEKQDKARSGSDSDGRGEPARPFERMFLGAKPSQAEKKFKNDEEGASEDDVMSYQNQMPQSPRQQQSTTKEKDSRKKVPKLSLENLGNALKSLASERREMTISPRKNPKDTPRTEKEPNTSRTGRTAGQTKTTDQPVTTTTTNTTTTTTTTTTTRPNTVLATGAANNSRTLTTRKASGWLPASPRAEAHSPGRSDTQPPGTSGVTTTTNTSSTPREVTSTTTTSAPATTANESANQQKIRSGGAVPLSLLTLAAREVIKRAQQGLEISGDQLAELLICVQSRGYTLPLEASLVDSILRGGLVVSVPDPGHPDDPGKETKINIIQLVSEPFIKKYLDTQALGTLRTELVNQYKQLIGDLPPELKQLTAKELRKNDIFIQLLRPLVKKFLEGFLGNDMTVSNSNLPAEFKNLLIGIDKRILDWGRETAEKNKHIEPKLLFEARKSAIAAYLVTRSISPIWKMAIISDPDAKTHKLDLFSAYLNTLLTTQVDEFYFDLMMQSKNQDSEQRKLLEAHTKASKLITKENTRKNQIKDLESEKSKKTSGSAASASRYPAVSREKTETSLISPRSLDKTNEHRGATLLRKRATEVDALIKDIVKSGFDREFFHYLKNIVTHLGRDEYKIFKKNPASFALKKLNEYMFEKGPDYSAANIIKFKEHLQTLIEKENASPSKATTDSVTSLGTTSTSTLTPTSTTTTTTTTPTSTDQTTTASQLVQVANPPPTSLAEPTAVVAVPGADASSESEKSTDKAPTESHSGEESSSNSQ